MMLRFFTALLFVSFTVYAKSPPTIKRHFTITNGLMERTFNSNEGMKYLPLSTLQLYSKAFDVIHKAFPGKLTRILLMTGDFILHKPVALSPIFKTDLENNFLTAHHSWPGDSYVHEFGHARSLKAWGVRSNYLTYGNSTHPAALAYYTEFFKNLKPFGGVATNPEKTEKYPTLILAAASGLNAQHQFAQRVADLMYRKGGHIGYFSTYLQHKLEGADYAMHHEYANTSIDVGLILTGYDDKITAKQIRNAGILACLFSGATWAFAKGYWDYIQTGTPSVTPLIWKGFRAPDFSVYYNTNGASVEISSSYQWSEKLAIDFAWEFMWKPIESKVHEKISREKFKIDAVWQITPGIRYTQEHPDFGTFHYNGNIAISNGGVGGSLEVEWEHKTLPISVFAKYTLYNLNTLYGERNIPFVTIPNDPDEMYEKQTYRHESPYCHELLVGISYVY